MSLSLTTAARTTRLRGRMGATARCEKRHVIDQNLGTICLVIHRQCNPIGTIRSKKFTWAPEVRLTETLVLIESDCISRIGVEGKTDVEDVKVERWAFGAAALRIRSPSTFSGTVNLSCHVQNVRCSSTWPRHDCRILLSALSLLGLGHHGVPAWADANPLAVDARDVFNALDIITCSLEAAKAWARNAGIRSRQNVTWPPHRQPPVPPPEAVPPMCGPWRCPPSSQASSRTPPAHEYRPVHE